MAFDLRKGAIQLVYGGRGVLEASWSSVLE